MQFSDQWKNLWPISSVYSPPLLIQNNPPTNSSDTDEIGPLFFNPSSKTTLIQFLSSPSSIFPPFPHLTLPRFLSTTNPSLLPSTTSSIAHNLAFDELFLSYSDDKYRAFTNSLQLLRCPHRPVVYAFFPAGDNLERVGFVVIFEKDSNFEVKCNNGVPFFVDDDRGNHHRIFKLLINPVDDFSDCFEGDSSSNSRVTIAYMLAVSNYSVYWYSVKVNTSLELSSSCPVVDLVGFKCFRKSGIVHACWSPHLAEESVVLLENGELFLFDLGLTTKGKKLEGKRLQITWDSLSDKDLEIHVDGWLSCEFSWHPRILIVAHSRAIYLVDMRSVGCKVSCLLKFKMFSTRKNDGFLALSKAGSDGLCFVVASKQLLLLCDVRKPMMPLLRWVHGLDNLNHLTVLKLSELRSNSKEDKYKWASELGYCIILGSFSDCEFSLFCYGPDNSKRFGFSKMPKASKVCAWGLPSEISVTGSGCRCGTCLVREEFSKESLPRWIDWRQKKDLVMGFAVFDKDLSSQLFDDGDTFGGFSLVRLTSSGKLEVQKYQAAWELQNFSEVSHNESVVKFEDNLLHDFGEIKYDLRKRHHFLALDNLREYISKNMASAPIDSNPELYEGAVSLGDDADNLSDGAEKRKFSPSQETKPPEKKRYSPLTPEKSQEPASQVNHDMVGLKIFDEGCPIELKFDDIAMDFGENELKMYKLFRAHNMKFQKGFKL